MHIPTRPTLPIELLDDIVSISWGVLDAQSISCIALTSHVFHSLVNKSRFGHLMPHRTGASHDVEHTGRRMRRLADLVRSGRAHDRLPNLCSFVTTFEVELIGFRDLVMPTLEDGDFAYILDNLFRANDPPHDYAQPSSIYSLSLYVYRKRRQPADSDPPPYDDSQDDAYEGLVWDSLDPVLQRALESILRSSRLNRLCLNVMRRLPRDFLRHSGIKHLSLRRCSISYSPLRPQNDSDHSGDGDSILQLDSLDIDGSVSCGDIEQIVACYVTTLSIKSPRSILPVLTKLAMDITYHEEFRDFNEVLEQAPSLRELSIGLKMTQDIYCITNWKRMAEIKYENIPYLQSISFIDGCVGHLRLMIHLLQNIPQSVNHLRILFILRSTCHVSVVLDLLKLPCEALDELLLHPSLLGINHVTIGFQSCMEQLINFSTDYVSTVVRQLNRRLASLSQRSSGGLNIEFYQNPIL